MTEPTRGRSGVRRPDGGACELSRSPGFHAPQDRPAGFSNPAPPSPFLWRPRPPEALTQVLGAGGAGVGPQLPLSPAGRKSVPPWRPCVVLAAGEGQRGELGCFVTFRGCRWEKLWPSGDLSCIFPAVSQLGKLDGDPKVPTARRGDGGQTGGLGPAPKAWRPESLGSKGGGAEIRLPACRGRPRPAQVHSFWLQQRKNTSFRNGYAMLCSRRKCSRGWWPHPASGHGSSVHAGGGCCWARGPRLGGA